MKLNQFDCHRTREFTGLRNNLKVTLDGVEVSGDVFNAVAGDSGMVSRYLRNAEDQYFIEGGNAAHESVIGKVTIEVIDVDAYLNKQRKMLDELEGFLSRQEQRAANGETLLFVDHELAVARAEA